MRTAIKSVLILGFVATLGACTAQQEEDVIVIDPIVELPKS